MMIISFLPLAENALDRFNARICPYLDVFKF